MTFPQLASATMLFWSAVTFIWSLMLTSGIAFGVLHLFATVPVVLLIMLYCNQLRRLDEVLVFVVSSVLWVFYLVRPVALLQWPHFYKFGRVSNVGLTEHLTALGYLCLFNVVFLLALVVMLRVLTRRACPNVLPPESIFRLPESVFVAAAGISIAYLLASIWSAAGGKLNTYFVELALFVPYVLPICTAYLVLRYPVGRINSKTTTAILATACYVAALLVQGSKSFIIELAFMLLFFSLAFHGSRRIDMRKFARYSAVVMLVFVSFPLAMAVRRVFEAYGFSGFSFAAIWQYFKWSALFSSYHAVYEYPIDLLTKRLNGYDGLLVTLSWQPISDIKYFTIPVAISNALTGLLPFVQNTHVSFGQAASQLFYGFRSDDVAHGGAVGLYGMMVLIADGSILLTVLYIFIFAGLIAASVFIVVKMMRLPAVRVAMLGAIVLLITLAINGGNFDRILQQLFILGLQGYVLGMLFIVFVTKSRRGWVN